jgi:outer membrane PBP1 activator LpoA protein
MQLKPITAIIVLLLVVASLLVAGCTTSTNNQTPSATPSTATHDAFLEKYLAEYKNVSYADKNISFKAWEVMWINSTSARLEETLVNKSTNGTFNYIQTFTVFPTSQEATNYLNAMNKTEYRLASTQYTSGGAYENATGRAPQIYKQYVWNEGNPFNISEYQYHRIEQTDNIVVVLTGKQLG